MNLFYLIQFLVPELKLKEFYNFLGLFANIGDTQHYSLPKTLNVREYNKCPHSPRNYPVHIPIYHMPAHNFRF